QPLAAHPREKERVAVRQRGGERLLDLAEQAAILEAHVEHRRLDDDAGIEAVLLNKARMTDAPRPVGLLRQPLETIVRAQGIAAVADEADHAIERRGI